MKTVEHKLLSIPRENIEIPEETLEHAEQFFKLAKSSRNEVILKEKMNDDAYFSGMEENMIEVLIQYNYNLKKYHKSKHNDILYAIIGHYDCTVENARIDEIDNKIDMKFEKILRLK
jgi:hypothetical protein